jgi:DNA (cytosine-5)-methyltransferase 1
VFKLAADDFGVPQQRVRVFFVGFKNEKLLGRFNLPEHTHRWEPPSERNQQHLMHTKGGHPTTKRCMGVREALGLPDIGFDALAPTIRSTFTGPRHTTSILNSVASRDVWEALEIWPNGVAATRELASNFVPDNEHFRLYVPDCAIMQGFPEWWKFCGPVYMALGQIGNSVAPPVAYNLASAVAKVLE